ncbi:alpha/beta hydrolase [Mitsuaria sp. WAJ17]|uniref:alpha/beta hydrolase n=1 Tax=Mitsuaria sp. WAJ17 TaxID=2761452 RepID=UPI0016016FA3|nr:alpha/beta hydrolase [Mitsuaria sp. WAJ17]MBB2483691.1 alpha/beta hydrolase [Mitsuaria sp. WAJ17]
MSQIQQPHPPHQSRPAVERFYAQGRVLQGLRAGLDLLQRHAPLQAARLALRLFDTPLPPRLLQPRPSMAPWQGLTLPFETRRLQLWHRPDGAKRPRVLLLHGWGGQAAQMRGLAQACWDAGLSPHVLDWPAHGRSSGTRTDIAQWQRALQVLTVEQGPWLGIAAHSIGALAAAHGVARGLPVQRLALLACSAPPRMLLEGFVASFGLGLAVRDRLRQALEARARPGLAGFEPAWLGQHLQLPVLLVHDRQDRAAPAACSEALAAALPRARLQLTDGLGHRRLLDDAAVQRQVATWLAEAAQADKT